MKWHSKGFKETRSFILGAGLLIFFAVNGNPLNVWWTIVVGGLLSSDVIIQAARVTTGGVNAIAKKSQDNKDNPDDED